MAKKDRQDDESDEAEIEQPKENVMAKKDDESDNAASTEGLVKVTRNGESLHVHPSTVKAHHQAGWKVDGVK